MDEIQKILVQTGRKDLAQKYYKTLKTAKIPDAKERRRIRQELSAYKKQLENFSKLVKKYKRINFDNVEVDELFDSSTNVHIQNIIERIDKADYELAWF